MKTLPLTKALHTTRICGRLARLWAHLELERGRRIDQPEVEVRAFAFVLATIGNEPPASPELRDDCLAACRTAIVEVNAENHARRFIA